MRKYFFTPMQGVVWAVLICTIAAFIAATEPTSAPAVDSANLTHSLYPVKNDEPRSAVRPPLKNTALNDSFDLPAWRLTQLVRYSRISHAWLAQRGFLANHAALDRLWKLLDGSTAVGTKNAHVLTMAPGPNAMKIPELDATRISQGDRYVQAILPGSAVIGLDSVVVRWRELDKNDVQELSVQVVTLDATSSAMPIWMYRPEGWSVGRYSVEIFTGNTNVQLVASGTFTIVPDGEAVTVQTYVLNSGFAP